MSGIKLFELEALGNMVGFAVSFYGLHCKNVTWMGEKGIEMNSQMLPKNFVLLSMTNKT